MSEQTPESAAGAMDDDPMAGIPDGADEPSMEDILASIRKIIADDPDPMPLDGPLNTPAEAASYDALRPTPLDVPGEPIVDLAETATQAESDADELDLDALLNDIHAAEPEMPPAFESADLVDGVPAFSAASAAPGMDAELTIPDLPDDAVILTDDDGEDDMDRLMNEMLSDMQDLPIPDAVIPAATPSVDVTAQDDDLDLVKSLMADLTDDDEPDMSDMLAVDPVVAADGALDLDVAPTIEDPEADILDSILDMTLADEIATGPEAALHSVADPVNIKPDTVTRVAATTTTVAATIVSVADDAPSDNGPAPSLTDIAAAAEADVTEVAPDISEIDLADIAEAIDATEATATDMDVSDDADAAETPFEPSPEAASDTTPEMEISMPRAVRSDAILDDVTEEATMSAFAQLNQVVEDKAVLTERGPRIGDLVQDALKPMLKEWLDENLASIVERAVAKEVKRLSSGK